MSSSGGAPASIMTAAIIVDELIRCGVQDVVVCPGSRSAPLALAFSEAAARGEITLHTVSYTHLTLPTTPYV